VDPLWFFNAYMVLAFYLSADPDPSQTLKFEKVKFLHENILKVGNRSKNISTKFQKPF
jgi:hypothetical protein